MAVNLNPIAFRQIPVTVIITAVYAAIFVGLLYVHHTVPSPPINGQLPYNVTEAFLDLKSLSQYYHPYNSHQNDAVRNWLLQRIESILEDNGAKYTTDDFDNSNGSTLNHAVQSDTIDSPKNAVVHIFNDIITNSTFSYALWTPTAPSVYFESTNIMVYVRGYEDLVDPWWKDSSLADEAQPSGVLVNAHYDSVSTGYGATDDGIGVVSILQMLRCLTQPDAQPRHGVILLLNNGEEDYLNGAHMFKNHPAASFVRSFVNLEGAGAGGRATMFRATDSEVVSYYKRSPFPWSTVLAADGFKRKLVSSETDYAVFAGNLGLRGVDIAFIGPRSRYHTQEDSTRWAASSSIHHMLSAALPTTSGLADSSGSALSPGHGKDGVWFDMFGRSLFLADLHTMFAISVTLLAVCPLLLVAIAFMLKRAGRWYLFASRKTTDSRDPHAPDEETHVKIGGWKGFFRFPIAFSLASGTAIGLAFLVTKVNPFIIYSSPYSVWSMMLCGWFIVAWFILRGSDFMRPTALQRAHSLGWLTLLSWCILVAATVGQDQYQIGGTYFAIFLFAASLLATGLCYLELARLPSISDYILLSSREEDPNPIEDDASTTRSSSHGRLQTSATTAKNSGRPNTAGDADETTSLLSRSITMPSRKAVERFSNQIPYGEEQKWSASLPDWLWLPQFLLLAPINTILVGQVGLFLTTALSQTLADGKSALTVYLSTAVLSVFIMLPTAPFSHRINSRIPIFLFAVFLATLFYNLFAFPFSESNKLKLFFRRDVDLDTGSAVTILTGLDDYLDLAIQEIPSAVYSDVECEPSELRPGLTACSWTSNRFEDASREVSLLIAAQQPQDQNWHGSSTTPPSFSTPRPAPLFKNSSSHSKSHATSSISRKPTGSNSTSSQVYTATSSRTSTPKPSPGVPEPPKKDDLVKFEVTRGNGSYAAVKVSGRNTKACKLLFHQQVLDFNITGSGEDSVFPRVGPMGTREIRLWSREWERVWEVNLRWGDGVPGLDGRVVCMWSDANREGIIPALDEVKKYLPPWAIATKLSDGLVEASKAFMI